MRKVLTRSIVFVDGHFPLIANTTRCYNVDCCDCLHLLFREMYETGTTVELNRSCEAKVKSERLCYDRAEMVRTDTDAGEKRDSRSFLLI